MAVHAVHGDREHRGVAARELLETVVVREQLGGAHKGEVEGVEQQHDVPPPELGEGDGLGGEGTVDHRLCGEQGGLFAYGGDLEGFVVRVATGERGAGEETSGGGGEGEESTVKGGRGKGTHGKGRERERVKKVFFLFLKKVFSFEEMG